MDGMQKISAAEVKRNLFYKLPKWLLHDGKYRGLTACAMKVYVLLADRHALSIKRGFVDALGNVYCMYRQTAVADALGYEIRQIKRAFAQLESVKLIERKRQGQGRPDRIYLTAPADPIGPGDDLGDDENDDFGDGENRHSEDSEAPEVQSDALSEVNSKSLQEVNSKSLQEMTSKSPQEMNSKSPQEMNSKSPQEVTSKSLPSIKRLVRLTERDHHHQDLLSEKLNGGPAPAKKTRGEFGTVTLTDEQYDKLSKKHNKEKADDYIARMDGYQAGTGKTYKNHYATISEWIRRDEQKGPPAAGGGFPARPWTEKDREALEERKRKYLPDAGQKLNRDTATGGDHP